MKKIAVCGKGGSGEKDRIGLVCIGKILQSLEGCACPIGALSREFLKRLSLQEDEVVLVDMEAGVEHFGRGVETSVDSVLIVTEPSFDSLELTEKINTLATEVGIESAWAILNKITSEEIALRLRGKLEEKGIFIPKDKPKEQAGLKSVKTDCREGRNE
jgi:CO dehydrogenase maturation factor